MGRSNQSTSMGLIVKIATSPTRPPYLKSYRGLVMNEWISVEDRLPKIQTPVMVKEDWIDEIQIASLLKDGKTWWEHSINHICNGDACCDFEIKDITHWMPLPELPNV